MKNEKSFTSKVNVKLSTINLIVNHQFECNVRILIVWTKYHQHHIFNSLYELCLKLFDLYMNCYHTHVQVGSQCRITTCCYQTKKKRL